VQVPGAQGDARAGHAGRGEHLGGAAAAQLAGEQPGHHHQRPDRQGGQQPQAEQRVVQQHPGQARQGGGERRLVDIPPGKVARGFQEIQLVAVVAVASGQGQQQRHQRRGDPEQPSGGDRQSRTDGALGAMGHRHAQYRFAESPFRPAGPGERPRRGRVADVRQDRQAGPPAWSRPLVGEGVCYQWRKVRTPASSPNHARIRDPTFVPEQHRRPVPGRVAVIMYAPRGS
jgi:hypothetical protein